MGECIQKGPCAVEESHAEQEAIVDGETTHNLDEQDCDKTAGLVVDASAQPISPHDVTSCSLPLHEVMVKEHAADSPAYEEVDPTTAPPNHDSSSLKPGENRAGKGGNLVATCPSPVNCRVSGLPEACREAGLEQSIVVASEWCDESGAADLEEVIDFFDEFAEALSLGADDQSR